MIEAQEISQHKSRTSCWVVIQGEVYDVTAFLEMHPGGAEVILNHGGRDATAPYQRFHPSGTLERLHQDKHLGKAAAAIPSGECSQSSPGVDYRTADKAIQLCVNVDDLEILAKDTMTARAFDYFSEAADEGHSLRLNRSDWAKLMFRPRILVNVRHVDARRKILGHDSSLPLFVAPTALARLGHPDGELCLARAAARYGIPYCVSSSSSFSMEDIMSCSEETLGAHTGGLLFYQLYVNKNADITRDLIRRAKKRGYKALFVTVDCPVVGKRDKNDRYKAEAALETGSAPPSFDPENINETDPSLARAFHSPTLEVERPGMDP